jgi:hypothetical protein
MESLTPVRVVVSDRVVSLAVEMETYSAHLVASWIAHSCLSLEVDIAPVVVRRRYTIVAASEDGDSRSQAVS